jgi:polysaccharide export outer membrane protein
LIGNFLRVLALATLLSACAHKPPPVASNEHLTVVPGTVLPAPNGAAPEAAEDGYRVGIGDELRVAVFGIPELSQSVLVDSGGRISLPLAGSIEVAGRSLDSIEAEVTRKLAASYVRDPQVSIGPEKIVSWTMTVDGEVRQPGIYPMGQNMTLLRAVASARGTTEFAKLQDVVVFRQVGDQRMAALYNLEAIRRGVYQDPRIYGEDIIVVGDSPARRMFRDILQLAPAISAPIVALLNTGSL